MYFSLIPTPGYNLSYLEACGVEGEWELFQGDILETEDTDRIGWNWGMITTNQVRLGKRG